MERQRKEYESWPKEKKNKYVFVTPDDIVLDPKFRKGLAGIEERERLQMEAESIATGIAKQKETDWDVDAVVNEDELDFEDEHDDSKNN